MTELRAAAGVRKPYPMCDKSPDQPTLFTQRDVLLVLELSFWRRVLKACDLPKDKAHDVQDQVIREVNQHLAALANGQPHAPIANAATD